MSEPFVGEIRMFAGNFAPRGWAFCDGQLLAITSNEVLFSLLGVMYGGDGRTTFGLPDLRGRLPIHAGTGPGLSPRRLAAKFGTEQETLTVNQLPSHSHPLQASSTVANKASPEGRVPGTSSAFDFYQSGAPGVAMNSASVTNTGGSQSHSNLMPYLCVNFIIALVGIYPSRT